MNSQATHDKKLDEMQRDHDEWKRAARLQKSKKKRTNTKRVARLANIKAEASRQ